MNLTNSQLEQIANQILALKNDKSNNDEQLSEETKESGSTNNKESHPEVTINVTTQDTTKPAAEEVKLQPSAQPRVKLGTPSVTTAAADVDILNSKSVEWLANNLDSVNKLIGANN